VTAITAYRGDQPDNKSGSRQLQVLHESRNTVGPSFLGGISRIRGRTLHSGRVVQVRQGWVYILIWFVPGLLAFTYFYKHDPRVLERRMQVKEKARTQKRIMAFTCIVWLIAIVLPGFDHRYGWSRPPLWMTVVAQAVMLGGYLMTLWVTKVNLFAPRTIQVESDQKVISSGPYRLVRHPMYLAICAM